MAFLVRDFIHAAPANGSRPVKKVRRGAATAFIDRESGQLIAGYSYNTCLYAVAAHADYPEHGRLYENDTQYGPTSRGHARWLSTMLAPCFKSTWRDIGEPNEYGYRASEYVAPANGAPADAIDVPRGASAADLIAQCHGGVRGEDAPYHISTTFAPPDGVLTCGYFYANRQWLDADYSAYMSGILGNAQRIDHVQQYAQWLGEEPCGCEHCDREYGPATGNNAA